MAFVHASVGTGTQLIQDIFHAKMHIVTVHNPASLIAKMCPLALSLVRFHSYRVVHNVQESQNVWKRKSCKRITIASLWRSHIFAHRAVFSFIYYITYGVFYRVIILGGSMQCSVQQCATSAAVVVSGWRYNKMGGRKKAGIRLLKWMRLSTWIVASFDTCYTPSHPFQQP